MIGVKESRYVTSGRNVALEPFLKRGPRCFPNQLLVLAQWERKGGRVRDMGWVKRSCRVRRSGSSQFFSPQRSCRESTSCGVSFALRVILMVYTCNGHDNLVAVSRACYGNTEVVTFARTRAVDLTRYRNTARFGWKWSFIKARLTPSRRGLKNHHLPFIVARMFRTLATFDLGIIQQQRIRDRHLYLAGNAVRDSVWWELVAAGNSEDTTLVRDYILMSGR